MFETKTEISSYIKGSPAHTLYLKKVKDGQMEQKKRDDTESKQMVH